MTRLLTAFASWLSTHEYVAVWAEGIALVAIFIWDRLDSIAAHKQTIDQLRIAQEQVAIATNAAEAAKDNAAAGKEGAEASNKNVEMFISKDRARLRVELKKLSLTAKSLNIYTVDFTVTHHGLTPAFITGSGCTAYAVPLEFVGQDQDEIMLLMSLLPSVITPNSAPLELFSIFTLGSSQSDAIISEINNDRLFVTVRGFIEYRDVFDRERETKFRYVWKFHAFPTLTGTTRWGSWEKCGADEDNRET